MGNTAKSMHNQKWEFLRKASKKNFDADCKI